MSGTTIPGEPEGSPYDPAIPTDTSTPYDPAALNNFDSTTLDTDQEIGFSDQYSICDRSGFKVMRGVLIETWDKLKVRPQSWERRQPLDFVRTKSESNQKGSSRPEQDDVFLATNEVSATDL